MNPRVLLIVVVIGVLTRLWLFPVPNNDDDVYLRAWSARAAAFGVGQVYNPELGSTAKMHPPVNYYFLWASGKAYQVLSGRAPAQFGQTSTLFAVLLKLPNLLFDLLIALTIFLAVADGFGPRIARWALCLYLISPAMIWEAGFVFQTESMQAFFMLLAVVLLASRRVELCWVAITLGVLAKVQCTMLLPLLAMVSVLEYPVKRLAMAAAASLAVTLVVLMPWLVNGRILDVGRVYFETVDTHPFVTLNAGNIWGLASALRHESFRIGFGDGTGMSFISDAGPNAFLPISFKRAGLLLFAGSYIFTLVCLWRRRDRIAVVTAAAFICLAFFMLPTQMTERYVFPFFPLFLVVMAAWGRRGYAVYVLASAVFFLNLYLVFPMAGIFPWAVPPDGYDRALYSYLALPAALGHSLTLVVSILNFVVLAVVAVMLLECTFLSRRSLRVPARD